MYVCVHVCVCVCVYVCFMWRVCACVYFKHYQMSINSTSTHLPLGSCVQVSLEACGVPVPPGLKETLEQFLTGCLTCQCPLPSVV